MMAATNKTNKSFSFYVVHRVPRDLSWIFIGFDHNLIVSAITLIYLVMCGGIHGLTFFKTSEINQALFSVNYIWVEM